MERFVNCQQWNICIDKSAVVETHDDDDATVKYPETKHSPKAGCAKMN